MTRLDRDYSPQRASETVTLNARDVADAIRLLRRLLQDPDPDRLEPSAGSHGQTVGDVDDSSKVGLARALLDGRRHRGRYFASSLFGEPAWDVLLALYVSASGGRRHTVSTLADVAGSPLTTTLRWLDYLEQAALIERWPSPTDKRVTFVELTAAGNEKLSAYFADLTANICSV